MSGLDVDTFTEEAGLAAKLTDEAMAWRRARTTRATISGAGIPVVRLPRRKPLAAVARERTRTP